MESKEQNKTERAVAVASSDVLAATLEVMNRVRPINEVPKPVAHRLGVVERMTGNRGLTRSEIALVVAMCAGEEVLRGTITENNETFFSIVGG